MGDRGRSRTGVVRGEPIASRLVLRHFGELIGLRLDDRSRERVFLMLAEVVAFEAGAERSDHKEVSNIGPGNPAGRASLISSD